MGSNLTRSTLTLGNYGIILSSLLVVVGQKPSNALEKSDRKKCLMMKCFIFLDFTTSQLVLLYAIQPVRLIRYYFTSILLYCYEQLRECISQVEPLMVKVEDLQKIEQDSQPQ